jgi:hypothetical protein
MHFLFLSSFCLFFSTSRAQSISTSTPVPPLQWINLTSLLQGPSAPPLKDASIGYDNTTRTIIIFGGESQGGLPQQQTYLSVISFLASYDVDIHHSTQSQLRFSCLVFSDALSRNFCFTTPEKCCYWRWRFRRELVGSPYIRLPTPTYRSSSRSGHVVIGGKGSDGEPLSDVWVGAFALLLDCILTISTGI